jgi:hypothetical protein
MGAESAGERFLFSAAIDCDRPKAEAWGELNAKMAESAYTMDHNEIARPGPAVPKSVEGGDARAKQRRSLHFVEIQRHMSDRRSIGEHMGGIAAVPRDAGRSRAIFASELFTAAASPAVPARPSEPADTCAITYGPPTHAGSDRLYRADDLVAGHARILKTWQMAFDSHRITVANATGMNPNQKLSSAGRGNLAFDSFEFSARSRHLHCNHHDRFLRDCEGGDASIVDMLASLGCWTLVRHADRIAERI